MRMKRIDQHGTRPVIAWYGLKHFDLFSDTSPPTGKVWNFTSAADLRDGQYGPCKAHDENTDSQVRLGHGASPQNCSATVQNIAHVDQSDRKADRRRSARLRFEPEVDSLPEGVIASQAWAARSLIGAPI